MTNEFATDLLTIANQAIKFENKAMVSEAFITREYNDIHYRYTNLMQNMSDDYVTARRIQSFQDRMKYLEKRMKYFYDIQAKCKDIVKKIYTYIDQQDPEFKLSNHTKRLFTDEDINLEKLRIYDHRASKHISTSSDRDILDEIMHMI